MPWAVPGLGKPLPRFIRVGSWIVRWPWCRQVTLAGPWTVISLGLALHGGAQRGRRLHLELWDPLSSWSQADGEKQPTRFLLSSKNNLVLSCREVLYGYISLLIHTNYYHYYILYIHSEKLDCSDPLTLGSILFGTTSKSGSLLSGCEKSHF